MKEQLIKAWKFYEALGFKLLPLALEIDGKGKKQVKKGFQFPLWKRKTFSVFDIKDGHNTLAVITGEPSDLFVIDIDIKEKVNGLSYLKKQGVSYPEDTPRAQTQSNGLHLFFRYPKHLEEIISTTSSKPKFGIDIRGANGLIFLPPSKVAGGGTYSWIRKPSKENLRPLPKDLEALLIKTFSGKDSETELDHESKKPSKKQQQVWQEALQTYARDYTVGQRSEKDFYLAITGLKFRIPDITIREALQSLPNAKANDRGQGPSYLDRTLNKARDEVASSLLTLAYSQPDPPSNPDNVDRLPHTDRGNCLRMVQWFGRDLLYCENLGHWFVWNGKYFDGRSNLAVYDYVSKTIDRIEHTVWKLKSQSSARMESMVRLAKAHPEIRVMTRDLDENPLLFNANNGTIDLKTGVRHPFSRVHQISKISPINYQPEAACPLFERFIHEIMNQDEEMVRFVQKAIGYSLTGLISEHCLFILYGTGANGKTTFINIMRHIFGDYGKKIMASLLLVNKNELHPTYIADLYGARFVEAGEIDRGRQFAESFVKSITGGDTMVARRLYQETFEFNPTHKIFLATNHLPTIKGQEHGIWRRIKMMPFTVLISDDKRDPDLLQKLIQESEGILAWAVRGCLLWQKEGLEPPRASQLLKREYREDMDNLHDFLTEKCFIHDSVKITTKELYDAYQDFCDTYHVSPVKQRTFGMMLRERGFRSWRTKQARGWLGLRLLAEGENLLSETKAGSDRENSAGDTTSENLSLLYSPPSSSLYSVQSNLYMSPVTKGTLNKGTFSEEEMVKFISELKLLSPSTCYSYKRITGLEIDDAWRQNPGDIYTLFELWGDTTNVNQFEEKAQKLLKNLEKKREN